MSTTGWFEYIVQQSRQSLYIFLLGYLREFIHQIMWLTHSTFYKSLKQVVMRYRVLKKNSQEMIWLSKLYLDALVNTNPFFSFLLILLIPNSQSQLSCSHLNNFHKIAVFLCLLHIETQFWSWLVFIFLFGKDGW